MSDNTDKKLAFALLRVPVGQAAEVIEAFCAPFPSLGSINAQDVVRSVTTTYKLRRAGDPHHAGVRAAIGAAIEEASVDGRWPAIVRWTDTSSWCAGWRIALSPYVGDRHIAVEGGEIGRGHGKGTDVTIEIDCLERPSRQAMAKVIAWIEKHPDHAITVAWSEGVRHVDAWREEEAAKDWVADLEAAFIGGQA